MATNGKSAVDNNLVVLQLSGGNDYLYTIVPYTNGFYNDFRTSVKINPEDVLPINDELGFRHGM